MSLCGLHHFLINQSERWGAHFKIYCIIFNRLQQIQVGGACIASFFNFSIEARFDASCYAFGRVLKVAISATCSLFLKRYMATNGYLYDELSFMTAKNYWLMSQSRRGLEFKCTPIGGLLNTRTWWGVGVNYKKIEYHFMCLNSITMIINFFEIKTTECAWNAQCDYMLNCTAVLVHNWNG